MPELMLSRAFFAMNSQQKDAAPQVFQKTEGAAFGLSDLLELKNFQFVVFLA